LVIVWLVIDYDACVYIQLAQTTFENRGEELTSINNLNFALFITQS